MYLNYLSQLKILRYILFNWLFNDAHYIHMNLKLPIATKKTLLPDTRNLNLKDKI